LDNLSARRAKTLKDIAELAGVSVTTVSKVINNYSDVSDSTRAKVQAIIHKESFCPDPVASSLSGKASYSIGVILRYNPVWGLHHSFFYKVMFGLGRRLGQLNYDCVVFPDAWLGEPVDYLEKCVRRRVDGVVLMGVDFDSPNLEALAQSDLPCLFIDIVGDNYPGKNGYFLAWDHYQGACQAVDYLYALGHRQIGLLGGLPNTYPARSHRDGFKQRLSQYGLAIREEWIAGDDFTEESGYYAMKTILQQSSIPTAVVCQSDATAVGALRALEQAGLSCPGDVSIVGYDDIEVCRYTHPALTTIRQDTLLLGRMAADTIIECIREGCAPREQILPVSLIVRDSCRRIESNA